MNMVEVGGQVNVVRDPMHSVHETVELLTDNTFNHGFDNHSTHLSQRHRFNTRPSNDFMDRIVVPKQRPFSGQNSRTTVGTPTVTVLGVVPKQRPFSGHPSLAINLSLCEIASTRKDVWNFFDYQPICDKQQPAPTGSNQHPPASTSTHRRQPVPNCIHEHHPAPPSTHLPPSPPITHHCP